MYYTTKEIAAEFRVSQRTIYNWIYAGKLTATKVGRDFRITEEDLRKLDAKGRTATQPHRTRGAGRERRGYQ